MRTNGWAIQGSNYHSTIEGYWQSGNFNYAFNSPSGSGFSNGSLNGSMYVVTGSSNGNFFEYSGYTTGDLIDDNLMNTEEGPVLDLEVDSSLSFFSLSFTWDNTVFEASASGTGTAVMEDGDDLIIGGDDFDIIYSGDGQNVVAAGDLTEEQADMLTEDVNVVFEDDTGALMYSGEDDDELT